MLDWLENIIFSEIGKFLTVKLTRNMDEIIFVVMYVVSESSVYLLILICSLLDSTCI